MGFRFVYLHLTLAHSKDHGHLDNEYLGNDDI